MPQMLSPRQRRRDQLVVVDRFRWESWEASAPSRSCTQTACCACVELSAERRLSRLHTPPPRNRARQRIVPSHEPVKRCKHNCGKHNWFRIECPRTKGPGVSATGESATRIKGIRSFRPQKNICSCLWIHIYRNIKTSAEIWCNKNKPELSKFLTKKA